MAVKQLDIKFEKYAGNPAHRCFVGGVQCTTYYPRVIKVEETYHMYYSAVYPDGLTRIHLATSEDLRSLRDFSKRNGLQK